MKKVIWISVAMLLAGASYAASPIKIIGCPDAAVYTVYPGSSTIGSRQAAAANSMRRGITIKNNLGAGVDMYISTAAVTRIDNAAAYGPYGYGDEFADNIEAYQGAWYAIASSTYTGTIKVMEKSSNSY